MQVQVAPSIPFPEKICQFSHLIQGKENKNISTKPFPRITGLQMRKILEWILKLLNCLYVSEIRDSSFLADMSR